MCRNCTPRQEREPSQKDPNLCADPNRSSHQFVTVQKTLIANPDVKVVRRLASQKVSKRLGAKNSIIDFLSRNEGILNCNSLGFSWIDGLPVLDTHTASSLGSEDPAQKFISWLDATFGDFNVSKHPPKTQNQIHRFLLDFQIYKFPGTIVNTRFGMRCSYRCDSSTLIIAYVFEASGFLG